MGRPQVDLTEPRWDGLRGPCSLEGVDMEVFEDELVEEKKEEGDDGEEPECLQ